MKDKNNFDLDVINALNDFQEDENNAVCYVRIEPNETDNQMRGFVHYKCLPERMADIFGVIIQHSQGGKYAAFNSVLTYLINNPEEIPDFQEHLNQIKTIINA